MTKKKKNAEETVDILIVEDSPTQAEALRSTLTTAGYDVAWASSGDAGLAREQLQHRLSHHVRG